ncbi:hypothetical protein ACIQFZ_32790 [Streptomyces sp. NPDC093064]|uniref:hypothetical protein n=1 Tax=Streptomyces sp. NPDC093064 TaxID=3366020 RepID=UPI00380BE5EA
MFYIAAIVGNWADEQHVDWLSSGCFIVGGIASGIGLVMLGRAILPGRLRRTMFPPGRVPPPEGRHRWPEPPH